MKNLNSTVSFLRGAFITLGKEAPLVYRHMVSELDETSTNFAVGDERFLLTVANRKMKISAGRWSKTANAEGEITLRGMFQMVDGTSNLSGLLDSRCLKIRADPETLLKLNTVLKLFLETSLKSRRLQDHFEEYRRWALAPRRPKSS